MKEITEEQIKEFIEKEANSILHNDIQNGIYKGGLRTGAKWMQEQLQPKWTTVSGIADLPTDNNTYWCEIDKKVILLEAESMRRGANKVKRYLPFIKPTPPKQ